MSEEEHALYQVLSILSYEKLIGNLEECYIFSPQVIFLGYVMSSQGTHVNERMIKAFWERPVPTLIQ